MTPRPQEVNVANKPSSGSEHAAKEQLTVGSRLVLLPNQSEHDPLMPGCLGLVSGAGLADQQNPKQPGVKTRPKTTTTATMVRPIQSVDQPQGREGATEAGVAAIDPTDRQVALGLVARDFGSAECRTFHLFSELPH